MVGRLAESVQITPEEHFFDPEYWAGHEILDDQAIDVLDAPSEPGSAFLSKLSHRVCYFGLINAVQSEHRTIKQLIQYPADNGLIPQTGMWQLLITQREQLMPAGDHEGVLVSDHDAEPSPQYIANPNTHLKIWNQEIQAQMKGESALSSMAPESAAREGLVYARQISFAVCLGRLTNGLYLAETPIDSLLRFDPQEEAFGFGAAIRRVPVTRAKEVVPRRQEDGSIMLDRLNYVGRVEFSPPQNNGRKIWAFNGSPEGAQA